MLSYEQVFHSLVGIEQDICKVGREVFCYSLLMGAMNISKRLGPGCI